MTNKDLDKEMAEIMGWWKVNVPGMDSYWAFQIKGEARKGLPQCAQMCLDWHPTESISDAFQVVEKMRTIHFKWFEMAHRPNGFTCNFSGDPRHTVFAGTAPLAICLAAKAAIEEVE